MHISKHNTINKFVNKNILSPDPWITAFEDAQHLTKKNLRLSGNLCVDYFIIYRIKVKSPKFSTF